MKRFAFAAPLFALALAAGAAQAQAPLDGNVVGGGAAAIAGGGDNMAITYSAGGAGGGGGVLQAQVPRFARARNGYGGVSVEYLEPETAPAGCDAWLVGGGDNAQVVYGRRR